MGSVMSGLSVVIPVFNGAATLRNCLEALFLSTIAPLEVVVVDDASTDGSPEIAAQFPVQLVRFEANLGQAAARNRGVQSTRGQIIFFLDADVYVQSETLEQLEKALARNNDVAAMFCSYQPDTVPTNFTAVYKNLRHHYTHQTSRREATTFCGGFGAVRRDAFFKVDGFDPKLRFLEDIDLGYRLRKQGYRIVLDPGIQLTHAKEYTLRNLLWSDLFQRAVPWTRLMLKHHVFQNDLNTRINNSASVVLTWIFVGLLPFLEPAPRFTCLAAAVVVVFLIGLNSSFLRFLREKRGFGFVARSLPLLCLGYFLSGVGLLLGTAARALEREVTPLPCRSSRPLHTHEPADEFRPAEQDPGA